ncbi:hypothetical protein HYD59_00830 [Mycoplasmopsis bovis]|nr:hypothetical protein HYD59_00830 [Mycoplasmopsis bovis]
MLKQQYKETNQKISYLGNANQLSIDNVGYWNCSLKKNLEITPYVIFRSM